MDGAGSTVRHMAPAQDAAAPAADMGRIRSGSCGVLRKGQKQLRQHHHRQSSVIP